MANVCCTDYYFYGPKESVQRFWHALDSLHEKYQFEELNYMTMQKEFGLDPKPGRGHITDMDDLVDNDAGAEFKLYMEDAWSAYHEVFDHILRERFPDISYAYMEFEPGCMVCNIHDPENKYFPERVLCNGWLENDDFYEFFESEEAAKSFLEKKFKMEITDIRKAEDEVEEKYKGADINVNLHVYFFQLV